MADISDVWPNDAHGSAAVHCEPSSNENVSFLDDMDSFWEDVNARFHVSRFVTDTVMKGVLTDVHEEAARQIASKDEEIASLNQKLQQVENSSLISLEGRDKRYDEFYCLREQLDTISKSLLSSE